LTFVVFLAGSFRPFSLIFPEISALYTCIVKAEVSILRSSFLFGVGLFVVFNGYLHEGQLDRSKTHQSFFFPFPFPSAVRFLIAFNFGEPPPLQAPEGIPSTLFLLYQRLIIELFLPLLFVD